MTICNIHGSLRAYATTINVVQTNSCWIVWSNSVIAHVWWCQRGSPWYISVSLSHNHTCTYQNVSEKERSAMLESIWIFQTDNYMVTLVRMNLSMWRFCWELAWHLWNLSNHKSIPAFPAGSAHCTRPRNPRQLDVQTLYKTITVYKNPRYYPRNRFLLMCSVWFPLFGSFSRPAIPSSAPGMYA